MTETRIPLSRPDLSAAEVEEVLGVLRTPFLSMGPKVTEFEQHFAAFLGVQHAVAVANGTCGLHLALRAVGVGPGTEVLTTPFTFVATANAILVAGGRPVFVDIEAQTLNVTPDGVATVIARDYVPREVGLPIVHDTCESFGSLFRSAEKGAWISEAQLADAAVYAFYPNKQITTGEGGMVVTADAAIAERCRMERNQGRRHGSDWLDHEGLGFNYRMDELSAALGVAQLRRVEELLARRARVAQWYDEALAPLPEVERPRAAPWAQVAWFVYVIRLRRGITRDAVIAHLAAGGIAAKPYFPPVHLMPHLRALGYREGDFPVAEDVAGRTIALPFFNALTHDQVMDVASTLREAIYANVEA